MTDFLQIHELQKYILYIQLFWNLKGEIKQTQKKKKECLENLLCFISYSQEYSSGNTGSLRNLCEFPLLNRNKPIWVTCP